MKRRKYTKKSPWMVRACHGPLKLNFLALFQIPARIPEGLQVLLRPEAIRVRLPGRWHQPEGHAHGDEAQPGQERCRTLQSTDGKLD